MIAGTDADLIEVGEVFIHLFNIVLLREGVADTLVEFPMVGIIIEQYGIGLPSVAPSSSSFLKVGFERVGTVDMDHQTDIGLVDTHTKGVGSYHHTGLIALPVFLAFVFYGGIKTSVVEGGADTSLVEHIRYFFRSATATGIDDGTAFYAVEDVDEFLALIGGPSDDICQILAFEGHLKDIEFLFRPSGGR